MEYLLHKKGTGNVGVQYIRWYKNYGKKNGKLGEVVLPFYIG